MKCETVEYFPTLFYEFIWTEDEIRPLLEELHLKKQVIKYKYLKEYSNPTDDRFVDVEDYWTDHGSSITLDEYNKLVEQISKLFLPELNLHPITYWTAIYEARGYHETHQHNPHPYESIGPNMSSILYLSNIGITQFYDPNQMSTDNPEITVQSEVGKMVMFPAHILHRAPPHMKKDEERIVISANWRIQETYPGARSQKRLLNK